MEEVNTIVYHPRRLVETAPAPGCFYLSRHAHLRVLERTRLSGCQIIERLNMRACAWLRRRTSSDCYYALAYCAATDVFVIAVIAPNKRVLKTILTREQWEINCGPIPAVHLLLAKLASAQSLDPDLEAAEPVEPPVVGPMLPEITTGLSMQAWARIGESKKKKSLVLLGRVPQVEVESLMLGQTRGSFSTSFRKDVTRLLCERPFFKDWLGQGLGSLDNLLPEATDFYLGFSKRHGITKIFTFETISHVVRDLWLPDGEPHTSLSQPSMFAT
jgi:hypothetical protein